MEEDNNRMKDYAKQTAKHIAKQKAKQVAKKKVQSLVTKKVVLTVGSILLPLLPYIIAVLLIIFTVAMIASAFNINQDDKYSSEIVEANSEFKDRVTEVYDDIKSETGVEIDRAVLSSTVLYAGDFDEVYFDENFENLNDDEAEDGSNSEILSKYKTSKKTLKKIAEKQINPETKALDLKYYKKYLIDQGIEELYPEYIDKKNKEFSKISIADEIMSLASLYYTLFPELSKCESTGGCAYNINGKSVSNVKVNLIPCYGKKESNVIRKLDIEDYILGVVLAEIGTGTDEEAIKAMALAARTFSFVRQNQMCPGTGGKNCAYGYNEETNIITMRMCENDQVYIDPTDDTYRKPTSGGVALYTPEIPDGVAGSTLWKRTMTEEDIEHYRKIISQTKGQVMLDSSGNIANINYASTQQNKFKKLAGEGYDSTQILMSVYSNVNSISSSNCSASSSTGAITNESLNTIIETARPHLGMNYVFGATGPNKWDCSSFAQHLYKTIGIELPRTSQMQYDATRRVPISEALPGDLLFKDETGTGNKIHHVAIYLGNSEILHASSSSRGILIESIDINSYEFVGRVGPDISNTCNTSGSLETGPFTEWRQYDPAWGSIPLGRSSSTIKRAGCLATSVAIQVARSGIQNPITPFNPGTFVQKGTQNGMFIGPNFVWSSPSKIIPGFRYDGGNDKRICGQSKGQKISTIQTMINSGCYVVLEVKSCGSGGQHWVAVTGTTNSGINMIDPASDQTEVFSKYGNRVSRAVCFRTS